MFTILTIPVVKHSWILIYFSHDIGSQIINYEIIPTEKTEQPLDEIISDKNLQRTTISKKLESQEYDTDVLSLYKDIKIAVVSGLIQHPVGSSEYKAIDDFFKFSAELIFQEAARVNIAQNIGDNESTEGSGDVNLDIWNALKAIYADILGFYGEAYYVLGQNGLLFSSLTGKSSVDPREADLYGGFELSKILPYSANVGVQPLGFIVPFSPRVPHPALPPTEIMKAFKHPIEHPLPSTKWLKFGPYSSFAPARDDSRVLFNAPSSSSVWFEKILPVANEKKIKSKKGNVINNETSKADEVSKDEDIEMKPVENEEPKEAKNEQSSTIKVEVGPNNEENVNNTNGNAVSNSTEEKENNEEISILKIFDWGPENFIDDDELEAAENNTESELVSKLLLKLQHLQRSRLIRNDGSQYVISDDENRLAIKIQSILTRLAGEVTPKELDLRPTSLLPVVQKTYQGALPAAEPKPVRPYANSRATPSRSSRKR